jgi:hypothetical protein
MIKLDELKKRYEQQNKVWIKISKEEEVNDDFYEFEFHNFNKDQLFEIVTLNADNSKENLKNQINFFLNNIQNWKNVKVKDILDDAEENEDVEFSQDALDIFLSKKFFILPLIINEINEHLINSKSKLETQKKT